MPARVLADEPDLKTKFEIDDADPENHVPTPQEAMKAPLQMGYWVMLVSDRAEEAKSKGDLNAAVKYYRAIAKATPDRAVGFKRMCSTYDALGDWENALASCRIALTKAGVTLDDYEEFMRLLLAKRGKLEADEIAEADAVIAHLEEELTKDATGSAQKSNAFAERLKCDLALRIEDRRRLAACAGALGKLAPDDPNSTAFAFALALLEDDYSGARRLIDEAKSHGVNADGVAFMQRKLQTELANRSLLSRMFGDRLFLGGAIALFTSMASAALWLARRFGRGARAARIAHEKPV